MLKHNTIFIRLTYASTRIELHLINTYIIVTFNVTIAKDIYKPTGNPESLPRTI